MALAEQGFYWPGMRADVSRICNECDCAMLKRRRGRREPLHQYVVGVPMERLAMDVAGPYPVTSARNQYCLMVGCYFSKWLECFPIPDQKATTVARKLVFEIVARYGAQSGTGGVPVVWDTQDADYALPPQERRIHRTEFQDAGPMFESGVPRDEAGVGRARATDPDLIQSTGGVPVVWDTQDADYALPPQERRIHRTEFQDAGPMFESGVPKHGTSSCH